MRKLFFILLCIPLLTAHQAVGMESIKWSFRAGDFIVSSPAIHNDTIFFGSANGNFYALNSTNGSLLWSYGKVGRIESSPAVSGDMVFFGSNDGYFYALWLNGTLAWKFKTGSRILSSPALSNDMVFFGSNDGYLYALWLNGTFAWKFKTNNKIISSPLLAYDLLFFDSTDGDVYAFEAATGKMMWNYSIAAAFASSPIASNWIVYVGSDESKLYAFNAFNGTVIWIQKFPSKIQSSFAVSRQNVLYFPCKDGNIYAVYAGDGSKFWNITTGTEAQSSVWYDDDSKFLYFGTTDNNVYSVNLTGHIIWSYETGNWVIATPLLQRGVLYVGSYDGNLYAISTIHTSFSSSEMNVTGSPVIIRGNSYADGGIKYVQVRFNEREWENASGTTDWSYIWNTSSLRDGGYVFEVRGVDTLGNTELPPYQTALVQFKSKVEEKEMNVSFPANIMVGGPITFKVKDKDGNPISYPEVAIFGKTYIGDENGVVKSDEEGNPIKSDVEGEFNFTVHKEGYRTQYGLIKVLKMVDLLIYMIAALAIPAAVMLPLAYLLLKKLKGRIKKQ
jgi:outer membrane protein assembly factor BamB